MYIYIDFRKKGEKKKTYMYRYICVYTFIHVHMYLYLLMFVYVYTYTLSERHTVTSKSHSSLLFWIKKDNPSLLTISFMTDPKIICPVIDSGFVINLVLLGLICRYQTIC